MSNATLIEVAGRPVGLAVREGRGFRFHATEQRLKALHGKLFATSVAAERAARDLPASLAVDAPRTFPVAPFRSRA